MTSDDALKVLVQIVVYRNDQKFLDPLTSIKATVLMAKDDGTTTPIAYGNFNFSDALVAAGCNGIESYWPYCCASNS